MNKLIIFFLILLIYSCLHPHEKEFSQVLPRLSQHFDYALKKSEVSHELNCRKITFKVEGKAKTNLRLKDTRNVFLSLPQTIPSVVNEGGLERLKNKKLKDLRTMGIKEHCLEVTDFECRRYHFRNATELDMAKLLETIESEYAYSVQQGEAITDWIQMKICPQNQPELSYLVQVP